MIVLVMFFGVLASSRRRRACLIKLTDSSFKDLKIMSESWKRHSNLIWLFFIHNYYEKKLEKLLCVKKNKKILIMYLLFKNVLF